MNDPAKMSRRDRTIYYQNIFKNRGYDIGPTGIDGIWGPLTNAAYLKYLRDNQDLNSDFDEEDFDENYFNEEDFNREDNKNYNVNITSNRDDNINDNDAIEKMWGKNKIKILKIVLVPHRI